MSSSDHVPPDAYRVLLTGFGPFQQHPVDNPSWLAVKPLHNTIIPITPLPPPVTHAGHSIDLADRPKRAHITAIQIPVTYDAVLNQIPPLCGRPPVMPEGADPTIPPPAEKWDLIFHIGIVGRGSLRLERQAHKYGYNMRDATSKLAPIVRPSSREYVRRPGETTDITDEVQIDFDINDSTRGFGPEYEHTGPELQTEVDVSGLMLALKSQGLLQVYTSMDAGHYLSDFLYYCSLSETKRNIKPYDRRRHTQVLFMHCPPVNKPLSSQEVTDYIKKIIDWVCHSIQRIDLQFELEELDKDDKDAAVIATLKHEPSSIEGPR